MSQGRQHAIEDDQQRGGGGRNCDSTTVN